MEEPSTLAESLLDDLDDLSDNDEGEVEEPSELLHSNNNDNSSSDNPQLLDTAFLDDSFLNKHLKAIRDTDMSKPNGSKSAKEVEQEEYQLIVQSNKQLARLGDELARAHGQLCVAYSGKFPELEEIIPNPVQYKNAVKVIRNEMDISLVNDALNEFMTANQVLTVSVSGSTTSGSPLNEDQLVKVDKAVQYMENLISLQNELASFVERRMERMAPNVSVIVGTKIAAQLLGLAGGLEELSKIPSCNLQVIGQTRHTSASRAGLGSINARPHEGILRECAFVQRCSKNLHTKALKTVAAKVSLAARCDFANVSAGRERNSSAGESFCREIEAKIQKWLEPDKAPMLKALPK
jgi:U4/U6 small nuclear ribonucleoprotein PRP31